MRRLALLAISLTIVSLGARPASAEGMLDIYLGGAFTDDSNLDLRTNSPPSSLVAPVSWDDSVAAGIRGGFWFGGWARWLGLALDLSYFGADTSSLAGIPAGGILEFHLIPITPMAMVRVPLLARDAYPNGQLSPYVGIGPGFFTTVVTSKLVSGAEVGFDAGLDLRAGVAVQLIRTLGVFVEYRRTDVDVKVKDRFGDTARSKFKTDHINGGIALRF